MTFNYNYCCACITKNEKVTNMNKGENFLIMSNRFKGFFYFKEICSLNPIDRAAFLSFIPFSNTNLNLFQG